MLKSIKRKSKFKRDWWCEKLCWWMENLNELSFTLLQEHEPRDLLFKPSADFCQHLPQTKQWTQFLGIFFPNAIWKKNYIHSLFSAFCCWWHVHFFHSLFFTFCCGWNFLFGLHQLRFLLLLFNACIIILKKQKKLWFEKPQKKYIIFYETLMRSGNISAFFTMETNVIFFYFCTFGSFFFVDGKNEFSGQRLHLSKRQKRWRL